MAGTLCRGWEIGILYRLIVGGSVLGLGGLFTLALIRVRDLKAHKALLPDDETARLVVPGYYSSSDVRYGTTEMKQLPTDGVL